MGMMLCTHGYDVVCTCVQSQRLATQSGARAWTQSCAGLLTRLLESEDAEPFMEHVDANIYPVCFQCIAVWLFHVIFYRYVFLLLFIVM